MAEAKGIYKTKSGLYRQSITFEHQRFTVSGRSVAEVREKATKLKAGLLEHSIHKEAGIHFGAWFETWIDEYKSGVVKDSTLSTYKQVHKNCLYSLDKIPMKNISDKLLMELINKLKGKLSYSRVNLAYGILSGMFEQAVRSKIIVNNPMTAVTMPKQEKCHKRKYKNGGHNGFLTSEEEALFLQYAEGSQYYDLFVFLFKTGLRVNEAGALRWEDVSFSKRIIIVRNTIVYIRGCGRKLDTPKSATSNRIICMTDTLFALLKKIRKEQAEAKELLGAEWKPDEMLGDGFIFTNGSGKPIWDDNVRNAMDTVTRRINASGIPFTRPTCHTCRKTFSNLGMANGINPEVMASQLGHSSTRVTLNNYREVMASEKSDLMELMDKVM